MDTQDKENIQKEITQKIQTQKKQTRKKQTQKKQTQNKQTDNPHDKGYKRIFSIKSIFSTSLKSTSRLNG